MIDLNAFAETPKAPRAPLADPSASFQEAMSNHGIAFSGSISADGKIHRFSTTGKNKDKSGWYVLHLEHDFAAGAFGDWKNGDGSHKWLSIEEKALTPDQQARHKRHQEDVDRQVRQGYEMAAQECRTAWDNATLAPADFPYLMKKGVPAHGLRVHHDGALLLPMVDSMGQIRSLQRIYPDGSKYNWTGGEKSGHYFTIPGNPNELYICEGYATGATIHQATGGMVVVAFDAGNLYPVVETIKAKHPSARITLCADNDQWKPGKGNAGIEKAKRAGEAFGVKVIWPEFSRTETKPTDYNDLAQLDGLDEVKRQIKGPESQFRVQLTDWTADAFIGEAPVRQWLVDETIPLSAVTIIAAMGDTGKGILSLYLALQVACGYRDPINKPMAFGHEVLAKGTAVYFTAEDDKGEIHRRLQSLDPTNRIKGYKDKLIVVPLPNAGGPIPLVVPGRHGPESTILYNEIRHQLLSIKDLRLVIFDPMASFVLADINTDPAVGAFTTGLLSSLATETGAAIIVCHHMTKENKNSKVETLRQAREKIRGSSAIVDGVRSAYAIWPAESIDARKVCKRIGTDYQENKVFYGGVVKSNGPADRNRKIMVRNDQGLLCGIDDVLAQNQLTQSELDQIIIMEIQHAASTGHPFSQTGANGIIKEQKHRLCYDLKNLSEKRIQGMVIKLLESGDIVKCSAKGSTAKKWLDVPTGPFALGMGEFELGKPDKMDDSENEND